MRITKVEPIVLRYAAADPSRCDSTGDAFLVRVHTDEGIVGIGEAETVPDIARAVVEAQSSLSIGRGLGEVLVGCDPRQIDGIWERMYQASYYYGRHGVALQTMSAIDLALWDIAGKSAGMPISALLGGANVSRIPVYASDLMPDTVDEVTRLAEEVVSMGFQALKLGWGPLGRDIGHDCSLARAAREVLGEQRDLMLDAGLAYSVPRALELLRRLDDVNLYWLEEPLGPEDYDGYRRLSDATATRIATGEAHAGVEPFRALIERGHVDVIQPDLGRCGGLSIARQLRWLVKGTGVEIVPHCWSTPVLVAASLHFAASLDRPTYSEFSILDSPLAGVGNLITSPFRVRDGMLAIPTGPGLGVELDEDVVNRLRVN